MPAGKQTMAIVTGFKAIFEELLDVAKRIKIKNRDIVMKIVRKIHAIIFALHLIVWLRN